MANIQPISALRNYKKVIDEVSYGNRVHLTINGSGAVAIISEEELEMLDRLQAKDNLLQRLKRSEMRAQQDGWISEEDADKVWEE